MRDGRHCGLLFDFRPTLHAVVAEEALLRCAERRRRLDVLYPTLQSARTAAHLLSARPQRWRRIAEAFLSTEYDVDATIQPSL